MKKLSLIILLIGLNAYSQKTVLENFEFNSKQINYFYTYFKNSYRTSFYIIINSKEPKEKIIECVKKSKKTTAKIFFFTIPPEIASHEDKEKLILEFIRNVLRVKLIDSKMNIISDFDYFKLYEETRKINRVYKYSFLNPINNLIILKKGEKNCEKIN